MKDSFNSNSSHLTQVQQFASVSLKTERTVGRKNHLTTFAASACPDTANDHPSKLDQRREHNIRSKVFEGSPSFKSEVGDGMQKACTGPFHDSKVFSKYTSLTRIRHLQFDSCHRANKLMNLPWTKSKAFTLLIPAKRSLSHSLGNRWLTEGQERVPWRTCR